MLLYTYQLFVVLDLYASMPILKRILVFDKSELLWKVEQRVYDYGSLISDLPFHCLTLPPKDSICREGVVDLGPTARGLIITLYKALACVEQQSWEFTVNRP